MKTRFFLIGVFYALTFNFYAQNNLFGSVKDEKGNLLPGVNVHLEGSSYGTITDINGNFILNNINVLNNKIIFEIPGYFTSKITSTSADFNQTLNVTLHANTKSLEEVQVISTRASESSTSITTIKRTNPLEKKNFGQDIPILLEATPSVVTTSDAGAGVGYTGLRIRGVDASRINVTINGIPVNDPESHDVYWVNMPDLASSIENLQIQRGVGSSTNGAASFGASLNIKTQDISNTAFGVVDNTYGSFNTLKTTIKAGTGLINNMFSLETRLSKISSDGFIDRASSDLRSYFVSGSYVGKKSVLKAIIFSGKEVTYQSWYGTPESRVNGDTAAMNAYADRNYLSAADRENLLNSGRTYNFYTYKNQEDNYKQDNYQLHFTHSFRPNLVLNVAGHYTKGKGYFEEYRTAENLSNYGMNAVITGNDTITSTDLIRRRWLDNDFVGGVYSLNYNRSKLSLTLGGAINTYFGRHFGEVIWARFASDSELGDRFYNESGQKSEVSTYLKGSYRWNKFTFSGDLQYRHVDYSFLGIDQVSGELKDVQQTVKFNFFNPKVAISYSINSKQSLFASYGIGHREPVRKDFRESTPTSRPLAEAMRNLEAGYSYISPKLSFTGNFYWMDYTNQLILTGQVNDVGSYTRTNAKQSYRAGIELSGSYKIIPSMRLNGAFTVSQNKIKEFSEYVDEYLDNPPFYAQQVIIHKNTDLAFSPNIVTNAGFSYMPLKNFTIDWMTKYVGRQYMDNTSDVNRSINPFTFSNLTLSYTIENKFFKEITFGFLVNNIFNSMYSNNGYTFSYISGGATTTENFYYPQAGRNFLGRILIKI
ncbi:MAG: TonB-dependent receptor [Flavobacteriales bacterium]|nr:TonB-dependent receptor [Flavobacteriales bacterium]NCA20758.1 TonB-dependent receptor [Crocinitomicaceae bacterium]